MRAPTSSKSPTAKMSNDEYCSLHLPKWGNQEWNLRAKVWAISWENYRNNNFEESDVTRGLSFEERRVAFFHWYIKIGCPEVVWKTIEKNEFPYLSKKEKP